MLRFVNKKGLSNMEKITLKKFKDKSNIEIIYELLKVNNGYVTSKLLADLGISRMYLKIMKDQGILEKVGNGIYIDAKKLEDKYYIFSLELPKVIYSHMTALYFHGLSIKAPEDIYDITVPNNYFNYKIQNHNTFYVKKEIYELGLTEVETPMGNKIRAYDMERSICDIIRSKDRMDFEHVKYSIKEYLKSNQKNILKLTEYAEKMNIKEKVMDFINMMYD